MTTARSHPFDRRTVLGFIGTTVTTGLAGCQTPGSGQREGVVLTHVELGNASPDPQVFDLLVRRDGEIVHWDSHDVGTGTGEDEIGGEVVEMDGPEDPGRVEVAVRVGEQWERTGFDDDRYDGKEVIAVVTYGRLEADTLRISRIDSDRPASESE